MDFLMTVFVGFFAYLIIFLSALPMNGQSLISLLLDEVGIHVRPEPMFVCALLYISVSFIFGAAFACFLAMLLFIQLKLVFAALKRGNFNA